jgi:hypothetical protein
MNMQHIEQLRDFTLWARKLTGKSAKFDVNFWSYSHETETKTEYSLWIEDLFHYATKDLRALMALLPYLNQLCNENKLPSETRRLAA